MNICALVPTWKRKRIAIETVEQILNQTIPPNRIVVVGSCDEDRMVSESTGVEYLEVPNKPLGAKLQVGIKYCRQFNPDALLMCGSDDWLSLNWIEELSPYLENYDLVGSDCLYALRCSRQYPLQIGRCTYGGTKREKEPLGPGRLLSRRILDKIDWKLYPFHLNENLDGNSYKILLAAGGKVWIEKEEKAKILSLKGDWETINSWNIYASYGRIKEIIEEPEQWLRDNFPNTMERLQKAGLWSPIIYNSGSLKIALLSKWDHGGSGWQIVQAVKKYTSHNIIHVKERIHDHMYPSDNVLSRSNKKEIHTFLKDVDIIHFKGDELPTRRWLGMELSRRAKVILTVSGSGFRRVSNHPSSITRQWHSIRGYVKHSDFRTAITPDLNYLEFKGIYTQELIDSESVKYCWKNREIPIIGYFPAHDNRKGFDSHIRPAFEQLEKEGYKFEKFPIVNVSYKESVELKKKFTIFIDQISEPGAYGNSALEAMQFGVPVIAYLSEKSLQQSNSEEFRNSPILNPGFTVEGLVFLLKKILDRELDLESISKRTKQYCDTFHGYNRGARMWEEIYQKVIRKSL